MTTATVYRTATKAELDASLRAEQRAVEAGHRAWIGDGCIEVVSDSEPGVRRHVRVYNAAGLLRFVCDCPASRRFVPDGLVGCRHTARAARRLRRERFARKVGLDGRRTSGAGFWVPTKKAEAWVTRLAVPADPFGGLGAA